MLSDDWKHFLICTAHTAHKQKLILADWPRAKGVIKKGFQCDLLRLS